jgi:hypothetical protein
MRKRAFEVLELYGMYRQLAPEQVLEARERLAELLGTPTASR